MHSYPYPIAHMTELAQSISDITSIDIDAVGLSLHCATTTTAAQEAIHITVPHRQAQAQDRSYWVVIADSRC